jgi:hypothetical protein
MWFELGNEERGWGLGSVSRPETVIGGNPECETEQRRTEWRNKSGQEWSRSRNRLPISASQSIGRQPAPPSVHFASDRNAGMAQHMRHFGFLQA